MYVYDSHELIQDNLKNMSLSNMEAWLFTLDSFFLVCISIPITAALLHRKPSPTKTSQGHMVAQLVEALRYKLEGCGFNSRWCHWNSSLT